MSNVVGMVAAYEGGAGSSPMPGRCCSGGTDAAMSMIDRLAGCFIDEGRDSRT